MKNNKRLFIGDTRSGKSHTMLDFALDSIRDGQRVIYMGKVGEMARLLKEIRRVLHPEAPSPILVGDFIDIDSGDFAFDGFNGFDKAFDDKGAHKPEIISAPAVLLGCPAWEDKKPLAHKLITDLMEMVEKMDIPHGGRSCFDVYCDEAGWCFGSAIGLLTAGNINLAYQSVTWLERYLGGATNAEEFIASFQQVGFFKSLDARTHEVASKYTTSPENLPNLSIGKMLLSVQGGCACQAL